MELRVISVTFADLGLGTNVRLSAPRQAGNPQKKAIKGERPKSSSGKQVPENPEGKKSEDKRGDSADCQSPYVFRRGGKTGENGGSHKSGNAKKERKPKSFGASKAAQNPEEHGGPGPGNPGKNTGRLP